MIVIESANQQTDIRQHKRILRIGRHIVEALVREMHGVSLFVQHVQQIVFDVAELLLGRGHFAIGNVIQLHALHELFHARLLHRFHQLLVLRTAQR